jgi:catechol-2,3-dioxygenase
MAATEKKAAQPIDSGVRIGHVHLKVANLERAIGSIATCWVLS